MLEHACGPLRADPDRCAGCALAVGQADHCTEADRRDACAPPPPPPPPKGPKKVVVWMANPFGNASTVASYVSGLEPHRNAFTGLAYQYFAVCGAGSNDPDGGQDCAPADATGMPHLAKGHPAKGLADLGARLSEGLGTGHNGSALELWPVISYGNPGSARVLNNLTRDPDATKRFIADAIAIAHEQKLTGFNIDFESGPGLDTVALSAFLRALVAGLHGADPKILLSYEGNGEDFSHCPALAHVADMDRWIDMGTYTSSMDVYLGLVDAGVNALGSAYGVGLCPICQGMSYPEVVARFTALDLYGDTVREIDMWAADTTDEDGLGWALFWPQLEKWLQAP